MSRDNLKKGSKPAGAEISCYFRERALRGHEGELLVAMAKEETPRVEIYSSRFLQKHNLGPASSVQRALEHLLAEEILERVN